MVDVRVVWWYSPRSHTGLYVAAAHGGSTNARTRMFRAGRNAISAEIAGTPARLGTSVESRQARLEKLGGGRLLGRFFAASGERLGEVAARLGVRLLANLGGCPAR